MTANTAKTKSASTLNAPCAVTIAPWLMFPACADLRIGVTRNEAIRIYGKAACNASSADRRNRAGNAAADDGHAANHAA